MIMIWFIGAFFTIGLLDRELEAEGKTIKFWLVVLCYFLWPYMLGTFVSDLIRGQLPDTKK